MLPRKQADNLKKYIPFFFTALFLAGCSAGSEIYFELPLEFREPEKKQEFYSNYSKHLIGKKIFIDPGHGGEDRRSIGPGKLAVEADVNLQVSLALKKFLEDAGVTVFMSRETDATVDLKERSLMANRSGADIFISIHHNAPGSKSDRLINYTSTYYHAKETDYEYEPSERDLARFVQRDLAYAMRNSGGLGSFDGTYSDYWIYPGAGFSVLRLTEIPAILVEGGFFTHPFEEKRLANLEFNQVQAWGIFRGIARYFAAGIPEIRYADAEEIIIDEEMIFQFILDDKSGINPETIKVQFDSVNVADYIFDADTNILSVPVKDVEEGKHIIRIIAANKNGNHNFPFLQEIRFLRSF
jgi:N-acetylmuramoyl-L-alanine amidase